ncbi:hypothetical protein N7512_007292 [Penicillium capsulatum]|nr:hypothetical protein N7512_007292 [Penicillium capsulatum]
MGNRSPVPDPHEDFTEWAVTNGVTALNVRPHRFEGRGLGMIALEDIEAGDVVVQVPTTLILSVDKVPLSFKAEFPEGITNHALLAAWLTYGDSEEVENENFSFKENSLWFKTWPTRKDFEDTVPILWPVSLGGIEQPGNESLKTNGGHSGLNIIPPSISGVWNSFQKVTLGKPDEQEHQNLMGFQARRLCKAYKDVCSARPGTDWSTFSYYWMILNTRSFYWLGPGQTAPEDRNEALALVPFADYFNHSDVDCDVSFTDEEYTLTATKDYAKGEEVFMNYGSHSNDLLLAEYGFMMDQNRHDCIYLDDIVLRDLAADKLEELKDSQYYGKYVVNSEGVCYRTEVVAALMYMNVEDWRNHVLEGSTQGVDEQRKKGTLDAMEAAMESNPDFRANPQKINTLLKRWAEIEAMCVMAKDNV